MIWILIVLDITKHCTLQYDAKNVLIGKVLIDNGSTLNVLSRHMLKEMPIDGSHIKPSTMITRPYDDLPR
jgi:hypothetical protein